MKRFLLTMIASISTFIGAMAMDYETAREQAYFLTDKMAYELNLNQQQYEDAYEINLDYLLSVRTEADIYSVFLDHRNADLRFILHEWQWRTFLATEYFFRPLRWVNRAWFFPIYHHYHHNYVFYRRPSVFVSYHGGHGRTHFSAGFYSNRRPQWHGGMRGKERTMVGHPNGAHGSRYGEGKGPKMNEHKGNGYHFDVPNRSSSNHSGNVNPNRGGNQNRGEVRHDVDNGRNYKNQRPANNAGNTTIRSSSRGNVSAPSSRGSNRSSSMSSTSTRGGGNPGGSRGGSPNGGSRSQNGSSRGNKR